MKIVILFILLFINTTGLPQDQSCIEECQEMVSLLKNVIEDDFYTQISLGLKFTFDEKGTLMAFEEALEFIELSYIAHHVEEGSGGAKFVLGMMFCRGIRISQNFDAAKILLKDISGFVLNRLPRKDKDNCLTK